MFLHCKIALEIHNFMSKSHSEDRHMKTIFKIV